MIVAIAIGLATAIQDWIVTPYKIPTVDGADAGRRPTGPVESVHLRFHEPMISDIAVSMAPRLAANAASSSPTRSRSRPARHLRSRPPRDVETFVMGDNGGDSDDSRFWLGSKGMDHRRGLRDLLTAGSGDF